MFATELSTLSILSHTKTEAERLQETYTTDPFFKTLFRSDHPFLRFEFIRSGVTLDYKIKLNPEFFLAPTGFGCIDLIEFKMPSINELDDERKKKRFKSSFISHLRNYLVDQVHETTESERNKLVLTNNGVNYWTSIIEYFSLISCYLPVAVLFEDFDTELEITIRGRGFGSHLIVFDKPECRAKTNAELCYRLETILAETILNLHK